MRLFRSAVLATALAAISAPSYSQGSCALETERGRDLNPLDMMLSKQATCEAIVVLFHEIEHLKGDDNFEFVITGGDRYRDPNGQIRSSTNFEIIWNSSDTTYHLNGAAVDVRIRGVSEEIVLAAWATTDFHGGYVSNNYGDGHWHFQFPMREFADRIVVSSMAK